MQWGPELIEILEGFASMVGPPAERYVWLAAFFMIGGHCCQERRIREANTLEHGFRVQNQLVLILEEIGMVGPPAERYVWLAAFYLEIKSWSLSMQWGWREFLVLTGFFFFISFPFIWSAIEKFFKKSRK